MRLVNLRTLVASAASIALVACGDDVTVVTPPPTITLNPAAISCVTGQQTALGVSVSGGGSGTPTVTFQSSGTAATVTGSGTGATITCGSTPGSAVITVTVTQNGQTATASVPVTVTQAAPVITSITVSPATATIAQGGSITLTPSATTTSAGVTPSFTFTSLNTNIATVNAQGVVTGVAPGIATIRVSTTQAPNVVAVATITVADNASFVQSLTVQPSAVTLQTGATQALAANVTLAPGAPANTSRGVTYTSSNTGVATVSSTGVVTAVANGTAVITVASQAAPTVTQAVSVTVRDPAPVRLTIQGVRVVNAAGNLVPADLNNVTGNLFVTLNLDPGDFTPDSVRLRLGNAIVNCQRFSAELAAAYRLAVTTGSADVQPVECQLNTSNFNATTGAVDVQNGLQPLTAEVFYRAQGAAAGSQSQQAAISQNLTINNQSGFFVRVTNTPTAAQAAVDADGIATGPQGVTWRAGTIAVQLLPVNFVPQPSPGPQTFTITLADANGIVAQRQATQDANNAATSTATFTGAPGAGPVTGPVANPTTQTLTGYTSPNAGAANGGTQVIIGTAANTANAIVLNASGQPTNTGNVAQAIYIDNQIPQPANAFVAGYNAANNVINPSALNFSFTGTAFVGFVNGAFNFQNVLTPTYFIAGNNANVTTANPDFNGVDRVTTSFFASPTATTAGSIVSGGTQITTGADLAAANTNTAYNLAVALTDALGNARQQLVQGNIAVNATGTAVAAGNNVTFGVDLGAPTIQQTAGATTNATTNVNAAQAFQFASSDDVSPTTSFLLRASRTARATTGNGADASNNALATYCATTVAGGNLSFSNTTVSSVASCSPIVVQGGFQIAAGLNGQYNFEVQARDQAGNTSTTLTRVFVVDITAPTIGGISLPQNIVGNQPATFVTSASDNLELGSARGEVDYGATASLRYDAQSLGSAFDNVFTNANSQVSVTIPSFIRSIQTAPNVIPSNVLNRADNFRAIIADVASNTAVGNLPIPQANIVGNQGVSFVTGNPVTNLVGFGLQAFTGNNAPGNLVQISGGATAGQPTSATLQVNQFGAQNQFISPFQRIELWVRSGTVVTPTVAALPQYRFIGTVPAGFVQDNPLSAPGQRQISSQFVLTASTSALLSAPNAGTNTYTVIAIGISAAGDAIVSDPITVNIVP